MNLKSNHMKQLTLLASMLLFVLSGWAQCQASFTAVDNGNGTVSFTNTSTGGNGIWSSWDMGDGNNVYSYSPTHTYSANGTYIVCLSIIDSLQNCTSTFCDSVQVTGAGGGGGACNLSFSLSSQGTTIIGTNSSSGAAYYEWYIWGPGGGVQNIPGTNLNYNATQTGNYWVCLYGFDQNQQFCDSTCSSIYMQGGGGGCSVSLWSADSAGYTYFGANATGVAPFTYLWDFGDGNTSTQQYPIHQYNSFGSYVACVTITDANQCTSTDCDTITISGGGCSVTANGIDTAGSWFFWANATGAAPFTYYWDFGDGNTSTQANPSHVYAQAGTYQACVTITDANQCTSTSCTTITVGGGGGGCSASFTLSTDSLGNNLLVSSTSSSGQGSISYLWTMGDGSSYTQQNPPQHTYAQAGSYMICLTISEIVNNQVVCTDTYCDTISVGGGSSLNIFFSSSIQTGLFEAPTTLNELELFPNPVSSQATLLIHSSENANATVTVFNATGQVMVDQALDLNVGENRIDLPVQHLSQGMYFVRVGTANGEALDSKFIKR